MPNPSLTALLDQLDELRAAATAGQWQLDAADNVFVEYRHEGELYTDGLVSGAYTTAADAALIVGAVNTVGSLTAAIRAVLELADELDREGVVQLFHGPSNRNRHITDRIRTALSVTP